LIHRYGKKFIVRSDDGQEMKLKAGRKTIFTPNAWPNVGDKLRIRYFNKASMWGDYFIAFEVRKVK